MGTITEVKLAPTAQAPIIGEGASPLFDTLEEARQRPYRGRGNSPWSLFRFISKEGRVVFIWSGSKVCAAEAILTDLGWSGSKVKDDDMVAAALAAAAAEKAALQAELAALREQLAAK